MVRTAARVQQLRILMIAPQPFFRPRGTPFSILQRVRALTALGHSIDLVTYPFGETPDLPNVTVHRSARVPGIRDVAVGPSVGKIFLDGPIFAKAWSLARKGNYDLIHTHEEACLMGAIISRAVGTRHLYDLHSSLPEQFSNYDRFNWKPVIGMFRAMERFVLRRSDGVIAICPALEEHVLSTGYRGPLAMIENTYDAGAPPPDESRVQALSRRLGLNGGPVAVYAGTLEPYQGLDLLLDAASQLRAKLPTIRVVIVGGNDADRGTLERRASTMGLADVVRIVPPVPPAEVWDFYALASVLVTCRTRGSNTPLKIYQYLRSDKPVVATAIPSHTQVLDQTVAEMVDVSAESIADGISRVLTEPARAAALVDGARALVRTRLSSEIYLERLAGLLDQVMAR